MEIVVPEGGVISGTFANGQPFAFSSSMADVLTEGTLRLELASLPPRGIGRDQRAFRSGAAVDSRWSDTSTSEPRG